MVSWIAKGVQVRGVCSEALFRAHAPRLSSGPASSRFRQRRRYAPEAKARAETQGQQAGAGDPPTAILRSCHFPSPGRPDPTRASRSHLSSESAARERRRAMEIRQGHPVFWQLPFGLQAGHARVPPRGTCTWSSLRVLARADRQPATTHSYTIAALRTA